MADDRIERTTLTRRKMLETAAWVGAGAAVATGLGATAVMAEEAVKARPPAYRGEHAIKPLPFDPSKLKGLSEKLLVSHHDNNYAGAVKRLPCRSSSRRKASATLFSVRARRSAMEYGIASRSCSGAPKTASMNGA